MAWTLSIPLQLPCFPAQKGQNGQSLPAGKIQSFFVRTTEIAAVLITDFTLWRSNNAFIRSRTLGLLLTVVLTQRSKIGLAFSY